MTVKNFWHNTCIRDTQAYYWLISPCGQEQMITRKHAAEIQQGPELPHGYTVERRLKTSWVPACPWCGVRPLVFEQDCDGWASTGTCGSEQCNRLNRCDGCGTDDSVRFGSVRGRLCEGCHTRAVTENLEAARDRYALISATW